VFSHPYIHNALTASVTPTLSASALGAQPLWKTALINRRTLHAHIYADGAKEKLAEELGQVNANNSGGWPRLFPSSPGGEHVCISDWKSAGWADLDFSAARDDSKSKTTVQHRAAPSFVIGTVQDKPDVPLRGIGAAMWEDERRIIVEMTLGEKVWKRMREHSMFKFTV